LAGSCATIAMDGILTPMDAVKQRMQLSGNGYKNVLDCLSKVYRGPEGEQDLGLCCLNFCPNFLFAFLGLRSLYAGYATTLVMNVPYHAVFFASYESYKIVLRDSTRKGDGEDGSGDSVMLHLSAGACAGVTAAAVTNPLDVAKTRYFAVVV
jgi:solute carrier family 25 iron transporter 28/37